MQSGEESSSSGHFNPACGLSSAVGVPWELPSLNIPCKDPGFLPVDVMCSLLDMHGNSIQRILALYRPLVFCHMNLQRPPGLASIGSWTVCTGNRVYNIVHIQHTRSSFHFREGFPEGILEVKVVWIPNGLHILPILSLRPLMYGRNILAFGQPVLGPSCLLFFCRLLSACLG